MFRIKFSREIILKILYQIDVLKAEGADAEQLIDTNLNYFKGINQIEEGFIRKIINKTMEEMASIDAAISQNLIGWKLERLNLIDRNLLRMGISESYFNDQKAIIIDDIIRIAKKYSEQDSYKIINAILDKVLQ